MKSSGLALILIFCMLSCHRSPAAQDQIERADRALREWHRNEAIIEQSLKGPSDPDSLLQAAIFFQKLTGIAIRGNATTFGFMPNANTKSDLERIRHWYQKNQRSLVWDEESKSVKLRSH
jgi:hypothetical protein